MTKSYYNPSFKPPSTYLRGPYTLDQGNNIWFHQYLDSNVSQWLKNVFKKYQKSPEEQIVLLIHDLQHIVSVKFGGDFLFSMPQNTL